MEKTCTNCKYKELKTYQEPCRSCEGTDRVYWKPKEEVKMECENCEKIKELCKEFISWVKPSEKAREALAEEILNLFEQNIFENEDYVLKSCILPDKTIGVTIKPKFDHRKDFPFFGSNFKRLKKAIKRAEELGD